MTIQRKDSFKPKERDFLKEKSVPTNNYMLIGINRSLVSTLLDYKVSLNGVSCRKKLRIFLRIPTQIMPYFKRKSLNPT